MNTTAAEIAIKTTVAPASVAAFGETVGDRIRAGRADQDISQAKLAGFLGISRAAVAQWESSTTSPSIEMVKKVARILHRPPAYIAYGVSDVPVVEYRDRDIGIYVIPEVMFDGSPAEMQTLCSWGIPKDWARSTMRIASGDQLIIVQVETHSMSPLYEYGDRVIINTFHRKPTPPGTYLIWDGFGPILVNLSLVPPKGKEEAPTVRISGMVEDETREVSLDELLIIGRVKGVWKKAG